MPAIFGLGKGRPVGRTQSHQHTDGLLFLMSIGLSTMVVYSYLAVYIPSVRRLFGMS